MENLYRNSRSHISSGFFLSRKMFPIYVTTLFTKELSSCVIYVTLPFLFAQSSLSAAVGGVKRTKIRHSFCTLLIVALLWSLKARECVAKNAEVVSIALQ